MDRLIPLGLNYPRTGQATLASLKKYHYTLSNGLLNVTPLEARGQHGLVSQTPVYLEALVQSLALFLKTDQASSSYQGALNSVCRRGDGKMTSEVPSRFVLHKSSLMPLKHPNHLNRYWICHQLLLMSAQTSSQRIMLRTLPWVSLEGAFQIFMSY